jgi:mono/diheme cytochrome c family protein
MRLLATALTLASFTMATPIAMATPNFTKDVAPILFKNCAGCHRPGQIAPMSLLDYQSARPWAKAIREAVVTRKMPPWFADPRYGEFANDARLTKSEIETVRAWVDGGAAEGDPRDLPTTPQFVEGWQLGKPDLVVDIGQDFLVPAGQDRYQDFVVSTNFTEGKWIRAAQVLPGNRKLVHHVHVYVVSNDAVPAPGPATSPATRGAAGLGGFMEIEGGLSRVRDDAPVIDNACTGSQDLPSMAGFEEGSLATLLPGKPPDVFDVFGDGSTAKYIPPGARLRFQIHYAKVTQADTDRTSVGLYLAPAPPQKPLKRVDLRNRFFVIPAGAANHEVKRCYDVEESKLLVAITPHMHYRGKDATYELVHADGRREILLAVPRYSFDWQLQYRFKSPVLLEKGSRMVVTFHYDNSSNNPANPNPAKAIRWGDRSEDEMMVTWTETLDASSR